MSRKPPDRYEAQEPPAKTIAFGLAGVIGLLVMALGGVGVLMGYLSDAGWREPSHAPRAAAPAPNIWTDQASERRVAKGQARLRLTDAGISIDEAMARLARDGWPDAEAAP